MPDSKFYYKTNRLQQLRGFCYTMRHGTLTKAARIMNLTHATVSLQIKALEDDLDIKLFDRVGTRLIPTKAAYVLMDNATPHLEAIDSVFEKVKGIHQKQSTQKLKIGGNHATLSYIFPKLVRDYLNAYSDVHVTVAYYEQQKGLAALEKGDIDLYILPRREQHPFGAEIVYEPLFFVSPVLLTLPDHPLAGKYNLTIEEIARYECIAPPPEMAVVQGLYERLLSYKKAQNFRITFENWEITRKYAEVGIAILITMDILCETNDCLVATPVSHIFPTGDYGALKIKGRPFSTHAQNFLNIARSYKGKLENNIRYAC